MPLYFGDLRVTVASIPFSGVPPSLPHLITLTGQSPTSSFYYYSGPLAKEVSREEKTVSQEILRNVSRVWIPALCSAIFFEKFALHETSKKCDKGQNLKFLSASLWRNSFLKVTLESSPPPSPPPERGQC